MHGAEDQEEFFFFYSFFFLALRMRLWVLVLGDCRKEREELGSCLFLRGVLGMLLLGFGWEFIGGEDPGLGFWRAGPVHVACCP